MKLSVTDVHGKKYTVELAGNEAVEDVQDEFRRQWHSPPPWVRITVKRVDDKPFFIEDEARYSVVTEYIPEDDPRLEVQLRIDLTDRFFLIDKVRIEDDPKLVLKMLSEKYGFPATRTNQVRFTPETPWSTGQTICHKERQVAGRTD
jgi:hypothetical protein